MIKLNFQRLYTSFQCHMILLKYFSLLSMLKTVLLNIFVETAILFYKFLN